MRKLAIFYANGEVIECGFDDDQEVELNFCFKVSKKWLEAPNDGIQAIIQHDPIRARHVLRGHDYFYALPDGMIHAADPLAPYLNQHLKGLVKYGVCLTDADYKKILLSTKQYDRIPRDGVRTETDPDETIE